MEFPGNHWPHVDGMPNTQGLSMIHTSVVDSSKALKGQVDVTVDYVIAIGSA
jgi:hypothetical protein